MNPPRWRLLVTPPATGAENMALDEALMMYTCGYWKEGTRNVEEAQRNKVEHVCRKLLIKPEDEVIDIGCGFGGFMFHAEQFHGQYDAQRTAINVPLSGDTWGRIADGEDVKAIEPHTGDHDRDTYDLGF